MHDRYRIEDTAEIITPALIVFRGILEENIERMIRIAGGAIRLRPHCKTHKMPQIVRMQVQRGITRHKCATLAEAEMLADAGADDVFLAYNIVGANIARAVRFVEEYPHIRFSVTADHPRPLEQLAAAMAEAGRSVDVLLDLDTGQHRTGLPIGTAAQELYGRIVVLHGVEPGGLHVYDGQNHQSSREERTKAVMKIWDEVALFRDELARGGWLVPRIVAGGTGSFPIFAEIADPSLELSPGTCVFHDANYGEMFPDLEFTPAALLLTRVVSRPTPDRLTLDLGYKAVASDPPSGRRVVFPDLPEAEQVLQNEEHLVLSTPGAGEFQPGDELFAIPRHVCPTSALHKSVYVVSNGRVVEEWPVTARDRRLTI